MTTARRWAAWRWPVAAAAGTLALELVAAAAQPIELVLPVDCDLGRTCLVQNYLDHDPTSGARDHQCGMLTYDGHDGTDFRLPDLSVLRTGVEVLAAADGRIERLRNDMADRLVPPSGSFGDSARACGNGVVIAHRDGWQTQYCHMAKGSIRVTPGENVVAGQPIGRVGISGNTQFPHLHLTVRHNGTPIDPFAYGAAAERCGSGSPLWRNAGSGGGNFGYRARAILNAGFASGPVSLETVEAGGLNEPAHDAPALIAFVRAIGLQQGDLQRLSIMAPDRTVLADHRLGPLERSKAQSLIFAGKRRPPRGWPAGIYQAHYAVSRDGAVVLERRFTLSF